jgi:hypothetical protein
MTEVVKTSGEKLKQLWQWFNGKKTNIAAFALFTLKIVMLFGVHIPPDVLEIIDLGLYALLGVGLTHKAVKNKPKILKP